MANHRNVRTRLYLAVGLFVLLAGAAAVAVWAFSGGRGPSPDRAPSLNYKSRKPIDSGGFFVVATNLRAWGRDASLDDVAAAWRDAAPHKLEGIDQSLGRADLPDGARIPLLLIKTMLLNYQARPKDAYEVLGQARSWLKGRDDLEAEWLYTVIFFQGVTALRRGETENCVMCSGECSCILPIDPSAVHKSTEGSRLAVQHFTEYLDRFPDDYVARWLLNVAYMTLGEHPDKVDPRYRISLDSYNTNEFDIGRFRDISALVGVNRLNTAGGAIMDDFDNDGRLDLVTTTWEADQPMSFFHNQGDGTFEDRARQAHLDAQVGGVNCVQTDYNNDGFLDIFVVRGAWLESAIRPSLLRNNGDGTFTDVTREAGLIEPGNSISATWADYDNDGFLDLFVCCEKQPNRLYRNKGDGTFEEVAAKAGVRGRGGRCKGAAWIDYDNDDFPDLFLTYLDAPAQLFHNNHDGTFTDVTEAMGIHGPNRGFSCWAWDYDNDGYLDLFATSYDFTLEDIVKGMLGQPFESSDTNKLYRNMGGKGFQDVTKEAGLEMPFATMGSNFADFDNDGYLDFYLGTGDPYLETLVPNRMFKNVGGKRFAEITSSSGTGHLQKGHGVAIGDWARDGHNDLFIEMGGASDGDKYHDILFRNPGQGNHWLTVKLVGAMTDRPAVGPAVKKTNRPAIGARIKAVTAGNAPLTVHRHVSSGSSFGANPLQQTLGLGKATRIADLEIHWPTSGTTQVFHDIDVDQAIEVTEFADDYRKLDWKPIPVPK